MPDKKYKFKSLQGWNLKPHYYEVKKANILRKLPFVWNAIMVQFIVAWFSKINFFEIPYFYIHYNGQQILTSLKLKFEILIFRIIGHLINRKCNKTEFQNKYSNYCYIASLKQFLTYSARSALSNISAVSQHNWFFKNLSSNYYFC